MNKFVRKYCFFREKWNLWTYNVKQNELAQVFSFSNIEGNDARSRCDQHNIRIISVEKNGSTAFAVYGYMNRGAHEEKSELIFTIMILKKM